MSIKKQFADIHALLVANSDKKVKDIMALAIELMEAKQRDSNHFEDEYGLWVFCYYHKEWELTTQVEYGSKANTATGLNTMCKVGVNQWTKQQRDFKEAKANLLEKVVSGELEPTEVAGKIERLEEARKSIKPLIESHEEEAYKMAEE